MVPRKFSDILIEEYEYKALWQEHFSKYTHLPFVIVQNAGFWETFINIAIKMKYSQQPPLEQVDKQLGKGRTRFGITPSWKLHRQAAAGFSLEAVSENTSFGWWVLGESLAFLHLLVLRRLSFCTRFSAE